MMITGDFNTERADTGDSASLDNLEAGNNWECISRGHDEATTATSGEKYDHFCVTPGLDDEYVDDSFDVRREIADVFPRMFRQTISNHCPVTVRLNDTDTAGQIAAEFIPAAEHTASSRQATAREEEVEAETWGTARPSQTRTSADSDRRV